jgi:N-methylhydantoinase B
MTISRTTLDIYRHLFASVAEEMGEVLRRAGFSPNIRERCDFSCALFDAGGEIVSQAAHIPVHLGSVPLSVRVAVDEVDMDDADHVCLNDPFAGGTHIPDLTFVSPVRAPDSEQINFYVVNRAHHADMGGKSPGSLVLAKTIDEEGVRISPVEWGPDVRDRILEASRTPEERIGDLKAQIAANERGRTRLQEYLKGDDAEVLDAVQQLQDYGHRLMKREITDMPNGEWTFRDYLDDDGFGNGPLPIVCRVTIDGDTLVVDFTETCEQTTGPVNVPRAVTLSAVYYVAKALAGSDLPSNSGYMRPIEVKTEKGSLVDATEPAAVSIGNVETSQRITDAVIGAFGEAMPERLPAASGGSMNNILVGGETESGPYTYYETIGSGSGASVDTDGEDAVQTHMTNTKNTPVESLEQAYPFRIESYQIRTGSGGDGRFKGGDGLVRDYRFPASATVTLMTERRRHFPWSKAGGEKGRSGSNILLTNDARRRLPGKCTLSVEEGDVIRIETPGGGGYGDPSE